MPIQLLTTSGLLAPKELELDLKTPLQLNKRLFRLRLPHVIKDHLFCLYFFCYFVSV
jgi:hypothetical protein